MLIYDFYTVSLLISGTKLPSLPTRAGYGVMDLTGQRMRRRPVDRYIYFTGG